MMIDGYTADFIRRQAAIDAIIKDKKTKLDKAKSIVQVYFVVANCGLFDCRDYAGDAKCILYDEDGLTILWCRNWAYLEVLGLTDEQFAELQRFYDSLKEEN